MQDNLILKITRIPSVIPTTIAKIISLFNSSSFLLLDSLSLLNDIAIYTEQGWMVHAIEKTTFIYFQKWSFTLIRETGLYLEI